jgi:hypothetical protein
MVWWFRRRLRPGKDAGINRSKSGISVGPWPPGATIGFGRQGTRATLGLPGAGHSCRKARYWGAQPEVRRAETLTVSPPDRPPHSKLGTVLLVVVVVASVLGALWLVDPP